MSVVDDLAIVEDETDIAIAVAVDAVAVDAVAVDDIVAASVDRRQQVRTSTLCTTMRMSTAERSACDGTVPGDMGPVSESPWMSWSG